jgi:uncharacterized protein YkwD
MTQLGKHSSFTTRLAPASLLFLLLSVVLGFMPAHAAKSRSSLKPGAVQEWLDKYYLPLPAEGAPYGVYTDAQAQAYADQVFALTNAERAKKGHTQLRRNPHLDAVAQAHAIHMAQARFFEHESPLGMEVFQRLDAAGSPGWSWAGENIAAGYRTPEVAMKEWMDSSGHRKNIRNEEYREIGVGVYYDASTEYGWFWVQVFATFDGRYEVARLNDEAPGWLPTRGAGSALSSTRFMGSISNGEAAVPGHALAASTAEGRDYPPDETVATADAPVEPGVAPAVPLELEATDDGPDWTEAHPQSQQDPQ